MKLKITKILLLFGLLVPTVASAVTEEDFKAKTTQNFINLCTVSEEDPRHREAIHFCHGYLVGAYHYHYAINDGPDLKQHICFPDPEPTRNEAIAKVIMWMQQHPEHLNESPVETEFRALMDLWPCKK